MPKEADHALCMIDDWQWPNQPELKRAGISMSLQPVFGLFVYARAPIHA